MGEPGERDRPIPPTMFPAAAGARKTIDAELGAIFEERWKRWHA